MTWLRSLTMLAWCVALGLIMPLWIGWWGVLFDALWLGAWITRDIRRKADV